VVFTRNATEAINLVAYSWGRRNIGRGDAIVLTEMEHHANLVPWQLLVQEKDGDLEFIPITDDGLLRLDVYEVLLRVRPKLVAFTHVSNTLGTINPVRELVDAAHEVGALVLVDGAQAVPHVPVDVQALDADFYAFSGHKMLAPMGSGALWARRELLEAMPPFLGGGEMIREVHLRRSDFNEIPWKFEAGTPAAADAVGLGVAAEYLMELGMDRVRVHERDLVAYALDVLPREVPGIELYGPLDPDLRGGVVPFNLPGIHPHDVAQVLDRFGIAVRAGHHCTMPLHERLDLAATARASFNVYSTREDIDALVRGLREVQRIFGE
jgi:cysteine desulfurase/selenocysteine lyase